MSPRTLDTIGADTATTSGLAVGTTSNVWTEATASAAQAYQGFIPLLMSNDAAMAGALNVSVDIGIGASGAEVSHDGGMGWATTTDETVEHFTPGMFGGFVHAPCPAGARVAVRVRDGSMANNTPTVCLMGVPYA